jgi:hypothetical protein
VACTQVAANGDMFNMFVDADGEVQRVAVGNIKDLETIGINEVGGMPVSQLLKSHRSKARLTAFLDPTPLPLPLNAPGNITEAGPGPMPSFASHLPASQAKFPVWSASLW